jgi:FkbM family methyltransferase
MFKQKQSTLNQVAAARYHALKIRLNDINYKYKIYAFKRRFQNVTFKSYDFSSCNDILLSELYARASKNEIVYDIGAFHGTYTLPLAAKECLLYAFEPNPDSFNKLLINVNLNGFKNATAYNIGLSQSQNYLKFFVSSDPSRSSFNHYNAVYGRNKIVDTTYVKLETIDNLVENKKINPPHHVKIDVEGHDLEVLRGGEETIITYKPTIYFEPHEISNGNIREKELHQFFKTTGYKITKYGHQWICTP